MHNVHLTGLLTCANDEELRIVQRHLPKHEHLTRDEPGCEHFSVKQTSDPLVWKVSERFTDQSSFDANQTRSQDSEWGRETAHIARSYSITHGNS